MEGEQERGEKIEGMTEARETSPKIATDDATTISMVEEVGNATSVDDNRVCSNERSQENKSSSC